MYTKTEGTIPAETALFRLRGLSPHFFGGMVVKRYRFPCGCVFERRSERPDDVFFTSKCDEADVGMHQTLRVMSTLGSFNPSMYTRPEFRYREEDVV